MSHEAVATISDERFIPQVTFDVRLGSKVEYIDFDYEAYTEHLRESGLTSEEIRATSIIFLAKGGDLDNADSKEAESVRLPDHVNGNYSPRTQSMKVKVHKSKSTNKILVHESQHRIDHILGAQWLQYDPNKMQKSYDTMVASLKLGMVGVGGALATSKWGIDNDLIQKTIAGSTMTGLLGSLANMGHKFLPYIRDPFEVRARDAEKSVDTQFVSVKYK